MLMLCTILLPIPLTRFMGYVGFGILCLIYIATIYYAIRVEKHKKNFNIQTYKEIVEAVSKESNLDIKITDEIHMNKKAGLVIQNMQNPEHYMNQ